MQHKKLESNLSSSHIDHFENDSFVEKPVVPDSEQNQETEQDVLSQTIDTEDSGNEKSNNEPVFKNQEQTEKCYPVKE